MMNDDELVIKKPVIEFKEYERLINESAEVADYINSIELTEDNVKDVKKVLAKANKSIKVLNDKRIAIKKEIMEPYDTFHNQIKTIEKIIKDADERLRHEVRKIDEKAREDKEAAIKSMYEKRVMGYEYASLMTFEEFIEPSHLNKTYSMNKVEDDMVDFLEKSENDLRILCQRDNKDEGIDIYKSTKDLGRTLSILEEKEKQRKEIKEKLKEVGIEEEKKEEVFVFTIRSKKDAKFVEMLLKENGIDYQVKEI